MFPQIETLAEKWAALGLRVDRGGARLVGHVPQCAPDGYLHTLFAGLMQTDIKALRLRLMPYPLSGYERLLLSYNGLDLFMGAISLFGLRHSFSRDPSAPREPFDLFENNTLHRPRFLKSTELHIGSNGVDGGFYSVDVDGCIYKYKKESSAALKQWENMESFIDNELSIAAKLFDKNGSYNPTTSE